MVLLDRVEIAPEPEQAVLTSKSVAPDRRVMRIREIYRQPFHISEVVLDADVVVSTPFDDAVLTPELTSGDDNVARPVYLRRVRGTEARALDPVYAGPRWTRSRGVVRVWHYSNH